MAITFPSQVNGQAADAAFINAIADTVEAHDAALEAMSADTYGIGRYHSTAATKATTAAASDIAIADYQIGPVDIPAGRVVEFVARMRVQTTVAGDVALIRLKQNTPTGPVAGEEPIHLPVTGMPFSRTLVFPWRSTGGSLTWLLTVQRVTGTGSITVTVGGSTLPGYLYARDVIADTQFAIV